MAPLPGSGSNLFLSETLLSGLLFFFIHFLCVTYTLVILDVWKDILPTIKGSAAGLDTSNSIVDRRLVASFALKCWEYVLRRNKNNLFDLSETTIYNNGKHQVAL